MFKKKKYTVIRQAISKDLATFVANYFMMQKQVYDTCKTQKYFSPFENIMGHYEGKDQQIPETYSQYANIAMETLMLKCQPGIYLETSEETNKKEIKVDLKPGDMLVYSGCELEHWRKKFKGNTCVQVFLHYNNCKTPGSKDNMFDKRLHLGLPNWFKR